MREYIRQNAKYIAALLFGVLATLLKQYLDLEIPEKVQDFIIVGITAYIVKRIANTATLTTGETVNVNDVREVVDAKVGEAIRAEPTHPGVLPPWKKGIK